MKAKGTYSVTQWKEDTISEISPDMKLTRATVEYGLTGEIEGKATVEYLMFYSTFDAKDQHNSAATYVGLFRFEGKLAGKSGGFVMRDTGEFKGGSAYSTLRIEEGSGTGSLKGVTGHGFYRADREGIVIELDYQ